MKGKVTHGLFIPEDEESYELLINSLEGEDVDVKVSKYRKSRSDGQNKYYWSHVVKMISDHTGYSKDETHSLLSSMFLKDHLDRNDGDVIKRYTVVRSTTSLTTEEMAIYIEQCKMWASQELNIYIPD